MLERGKMERGIFEIVDTESLAPAEHLLRKIDAAGDLNKNYDKETIEWVFADTKKQHGMRYTRYTGLA